MPGPGHSTAPTSYVATPDTAPGFWQLGNLWRIMASGVKTGESFCLIDQLVTPEGGGPCSHAHPVDEGLYVVSGHWTFNAGGQSLSAGAGTFVSVPRYAQHSFTVDAPGTQLLNFYLPAGFEVFVMGFAHPAERNEAPPPGIPMTPRRLVEQLSRDYGQISIIGLAGADAPGPDNMATEPLPDAVVQPYAARADAAPALWHEGALWSVLADGSGTDGSYSLFEQLLPQGLVAEPHLHVGMDEVVYVLDGELEVLLGDHGEPAAAGALVFIPRGSAHAVRVTSKMARVLNLYTPAGFERVVSELGVAAERREPPPRTWRQPEVAADLKERLFADIGLRSVVVPAAFTAAPER